MPSSHRLLCRPLLLLPLIPPSIRVFSNESALRIRWPKYWSFSFSISPSSEHSGLTSFRMDWLDLLAVQGTLKSLLQCHSSEASVLRRITRSARTLREALPCPLPFAPLLSCCLLLHISQAHSTLLLFCLNIDFSFAFIFILAVLGLHRSTQASPSRGSWLSRGGR